MGITTNVNESTFFNSLMDNIKTLYDEESKRIVETHKKEIDVELEHLRQEIVTRAALRIEQFVHVQNDGREIRISILKDSQSPKKEGEC